MYKFKMFLICLKIVFVDTQYTRGIQGQKIQSQGQTHEYKQ